MFKSVLSMLAFFAVVQTVQAQSVSGKIKSAEGKPLSNATVSLLSAKDSSLVKIALTDASGAYTVPLVKPGKYFTKAAYVGYSTTNTAVFEVSGENFTAPEIVMAAGDAKQLAAVTVEAKRPMIEVRADKTILNVEGSINAVGLDALELMRKSPGVLLDKDDNISLSGKNGVQIYVDGKPSPLSGADLTAYLKTIQSSQVESIEIITNPSAKYEAAGNAGIINIRLKKNKTFGTNGSVNTGWAIGTYARYNTGVSLNHRNKSINVFGNYNFTDNKSENVFNLNRDLSDTIFDNRSVGYFKNRSHGYKAGLDYFVNKKSTIGVMLNGNFSNQNFGNLAKTDISYKPTGTLVRRLVADNNSEAKRNNANFNLNYRYADTKSRELNMDADYGLYRINNDQLQPNSYFTPLGVLERRADYNMIAPTDIDIWSFKTDYETNYKKGRLGVGGKTSYVKAFNDFQRFDILPNDRKLDRDKSNSFEYKENINALYVNYNRQFKSVMIQAGVRMENTNAKGISKGQKFSNGAYVPYDSVFNRHYTNLFPSAAITFNKNPMNQWSFSYSRRIDRPAYQDLNPFEFKLDEYSYQKGNTELRPQYTNSFSLVNTYKYKLTTNLTYSHVSDVFTQLVDTAEKSKSFITKKNLATQDIVSLNISYPFQKKWYSFFVNFNGYYSHYKANFGVGRTVDLDVAAFNIYMQHSAKLGKGFTAELSGWYNSPSIWQGTFESARLYAVDAGIQKQLWKGKANAKIAMGDIFFSQKWRGKSNFAGQVLNVNGYNDSRQFKINFTYRFGNTQVKGARQRKSGTEDENKRVGSQGGGFSG